MKKRSASGVMPTIQKTTTLYIVPSTSEYGPQDGREAIGAEGQRIGDGVAEAAHEVIGEREEVVALVPVAAADLLRRQDPVR